MRLSTHYEQPPCLLFIFRAHATTGFTIKRNIYILFGHFAKLLLKLTEAHQPQTRKRILILFNK